jgi:UDP-glucosyltransferase BX8/BX9
MALRNGRRRVVLFPLPYHGHVNPMLRLAAALDARSLAVTVLHTELLRAPNAAYRFVPVHADVSATLNALVDWDRKI